MTDDPDIPAIEAEMAASGISISRLLRRAEIAPTTWYRWKSGVRAPTRAAVWDRVMRAREALLREEAAKQASGQCEKGDRP